MQCTDAASAQMQCTDAASAQMQCTDAASAQMQCTDEASEQMQCTDEASAQYMASHAASSAPLDCFRPRFSPLGRGKPARVLASVDVRLVVRPWESLEPAGAVRVSPVRAAALAVLSALRGASYHRLEWTHGAQRRHSTHSAKDAAQHAGTRAQLITAQGARCGCLERSSVVSALPRRCHLFC
jgi:hypothetical protein